MSRLVTVLCAAGLLVAFGRARAGQSSPKPSPAIVQCANLVYAVSKSSVCFSDRFLKRTREETKIETHPRFSRVRLGDLSSLMNYPFSIMTGEGGFTLTEGERANLRTYLDRGGFLVASAGCSNPDWARSFRAEFARIFPSGKLQALPMSHALFRTVYAIRSLRTEHGGKSSKAVLEGYSPGGRLALVFSADGLNDTAHAVNCCCCGGDEIRGAEFVNVNLLAYALLH